MKKFYSIILIISILILPMTSSAGLIPTGQVDSFKENSVKVNNFINNADVVKKYTEMGIDSSTAHERINAMTESEINLVANQISSLPAGGYISEAGGVIIGVTLIVLVWIISKN